MYNHVLKVDSVCIFILIRIVNFKISVHWKKVSKLYFNSEVYCPAKQLSFSKLLVMVVYFTPNERKLLLIYSNTY